MLLGCMAGLAGARAGFGAESGHRGRAERDEHSLDGAVRQPVPGADGYHEGDGETGRFVYKYM